MAYSNIDKPNQYFNTLLWTGADTSAGRDFTGVGFQPDFVWAKTRSASNGHKWFDSVRGVGKSIQSESTGAETTNDGNGYIDSFDVDGFSSIAGSTNNYNFNDTSTTFVAWNWLAGGTASSNTDGSETTSVSANTTSGFSIVSYTGTGTNDTFGHGLGVKPSMIITKSRDTAGLDWRTYHASLGATKYITLNLTTAETTESNFMNNTEPTSSVFTLGTGTTPNKLGDAYIAYCFAEKKGFSKFGSYTGNGNADGTFVYTGFKPAFIIGKRTDTTGAWFVLDNKRDAENPTNLYLLPDSTATEFTGSSASVLWDFLSNGFKIRSTGAGNNASGGTYIYMAFAESPIVGSNLVPNNAR